MEEKKDYKTEEDPIDIEIKDGKYYVGEYSFSSEENATKFANTKKNAKIRSNIDDNSQNKNQARSNKNFLTSLKDGDFGLGITYWLYGVAAPITLLSIVKITETQNQTTLQLISIFTISYLVLIYIAIWNASKKPEANAFWASAARFTLILIPAAAVIGIVSAIIIPKTQNKHANDNLINSKLSDTAAPPKSTPLVDQQSHTQPSAPPHSEQPTAAENFSRAITYLERRYVVFDPNSQWYSQEAVDETIRRMNILIDYGDTPALAVLKAGDEIGPRHTQKAYEARLQQQNNEKIARQPQTVNEQKETGLKSSKGVFPLPPVEIQTCEYKTAMTDEEIARCRKEN